MKHVRRFMATVLAVLMVVTIIPVEVWAVMGTEDSTLLTNEAKTGSIENDQNDGVEYTINGTGDGLVVTAVNIEKKV